jgi:hypothetical protein
MRDKGGGRVWNRGRGRKGLEERRREEGGRKGSEEGRRDERGRSVWKWGGGMKGEEGSGRVDEE